MQKYSSIWVAVLGVVVGILTVLTVEKYRESRTVAKVQDADWQKLNLILREVEQNYVDSIDYKSVTDAAISAVLSSLDPHSVYLLPEALEESETELAGNFDGIGIQFNVPNDTAIVLEVIPGGPSEMIGLRQGDRLIKVDDEVIAGVGFPQDSMVRRIKGPAGSKVTVTVMREGEEVPFEITRGKIPLNSVDASFMLDEEAGYIRLSKFSRSTFNECMMSAISLLAEGMTHLVLDLRDNTGGYLDQALLLSNMFLEKGKSIVYMEGLNRSRQDYKADGHGILKDVQLSVLINESSASSSEIVAGAIQDNDRGVIIGRRSFGKGLVQEPMLFSDGSGIRITVARYYTPSGRCIQKPYSDDYEYDILKRYNDGELLQADSMKVNREELFHTISGREVFGGGGIIPDVFVPMDTTRATDFYVQCNKKATQMRYASAFFDSHKEISGIEDYDELLRYLERSDIERGFLDFARTNDGLEVSSYEWTQSKQYMMVQLKSLIGRYSKLGDNAYYHLYVELDDTIKEAMKPHDILNNN